MKTNSTFKAFGIVLAVAIILFGGIRLTTAAAQSAIPGDALYPVKTTIENTRLSLAQDAGNRAQMKLAFAEQRLEEISGLIREARYREIRGAVLSFETNINAAIMELETVSASDPARAAAIMQEVTSALTRYAQTLSELASVAPESVRSDVTRALDTTRIASGLDPVSENENANANNNGSVDNGNANDNANGNVNGNGDDNSNTNTNDDDRGNDNANDNGNANSNVNANENGDDNRNSNANDNADDHGNANADDHGNGNANVNANDNGDDNSSVNANDDNGNDNTNSDDNANSNASIDDNSNGGSDDNGNDDSSGRGRGADDDDDDDENRGRGRGKDD